MTKVALLAYACGKFSDPRLEFGPRWIAHHAKLFSHEDIYVITNHVDASIYESVNTIPRDHPEGAWYDVFWEMATAHEAITRLRLSYPVVVFTSMDEFLCTRTSVADLVDCNRGNRTKCRRIPTFDVIHDPFREPPIDHSVPTLEQRYYWRYSPGSTHPAIFYDSVAPALGFHSLAGVEPQEIPFAYGAFLAHLKREDYEDFLARTKDRRQWPWGPAKDIPGLSHQNKLEEDGLKHWYFQDVHEVEPIRTDFLEVP